MGGREGPFWRLLGSAAAGGRLRLGGLCLGTGIQATSTGIDLQQGPNYSSSEAAAAVSSLATAFKGVWRVHIRPS